MILKKQMSSKVELVRLSAVLCCVGVLIFGCFTIELQAQVKDIGLPFIQNYSRETYKAGTQNWDITQDDKGFMYFANNQGLLRYDGSNWDLYTLPNKSVVRSLLFSDGRLYVGGYEEFGYYTYNSIGQLVYTSLSKKLDLKIGSVGEIWSIYATDYGVVFQSFYGVYVFSNDQINPIKPHSTFGFSFFVDGNFYVVDRLKGLYVLQGKTLNSVFQHSTFFNDNEVSFMFSAKDGSYLLGTTNDGVFTYNGKSIEPWAKPVNRILVEDQIYTAIALENNLFAIGTIQNGVVVINTEGEIIQHLNRFKGLQNNTVLSLFLDDSENLWLGLDNGIDFLELSNPISALNYCFNIETVYTSVVHNGLLYVGTNQGLFVRKFSEISNKALLESGFELVENTKGQVWTLKVVGDDLICGHNYGTYLVEGKRAREVSYIAGAWDYEEVPGRDDLIIAGVYTGLELIKRTGGGLHRWKSLGKIEGIELSCRSIEFDAEGALWITHDYEGVIKVKLTDDLKGVKNSTVYNNTHGLPEVPYTLSLLQGELYFNTIDGFYSYNSKTNRFVRTTQIEAPFDNRSTSLKIIEDAFGDVWFFDSEEMGVYRLQEDATFTQIAVPFRRIQGQFLASGYEHVNVYDDQNVFIAGQYGLLHYNSEKTKNFNKDFYCYIKDVRIASEKSDSTIVKLYGENLSSNHAATQKIKYKYNSISFQYFTPYYESVGSNVFSCRLKGYDKQWSPWSPIKLKEYTNLREGDYEFEVKAQNIYNKESVVVAFPFSIEPPFFRSIYAFVIYLLVILVLIGLMVVYIKLRIEKARKLEKVKHQRLLVNKESEYKEVVKQTEQTIEKMKTEKLKNDMRYKNMELANATMHLIQKNKFLTKVKGELLVTYNNAKVDSVRSDIKQIIKRIDKDFKSEQQWKLFDQYFDEVHQDFIKRLRELHPQLTPNDLRLCAYLKMNLSTKEIAPLMNISIRGLEISRYRLRKKLNLTREVNLTEYILNV